MAIRAILLILGLFNLGNGLFMLDAPDQWYHTIPGVTASGPPNMHFIGDIGLAYMASGAGLIWGARNGALAAAFALAGATWPTLHALMHISEWMHHGFPSDPQAAMSEAVGVVAISFLGMAVAYVRARKEGVV